LGGIGATLLELTNLRRELTVTRVHGMHDILDFFLSFNRSPSVMVQADSHTNVV
jgi:hypothetical protein